MIGNYRRVIPRDFFNEAKLLKCLGRLELLILDRRCRLLSSHSGDRFRICQDMSNGSLVCTNYHVYLDGVSLHFFLPYNSKDNYPLTVNLNGEDYTVFDEDGNFQLGDVFSDARGVAISAI